MTERATPARLSAIVFAVLVLATVGAFFVAQRLKRSAPLVTRISMPVYISPNHDGRKDTATIGFRLPKAGRLRVSIVNAAGDEVRRLADRHLSSGGHRFVWNGHDSSGAIPPDGSYYLRVILVGEGRGTITRRGILLVTKPTYPKLVSVTPNRIAPGSHQLVSIKFTGPTNPKPLISVFRTDSGPPRLVERFTASLGTNIAVWDGFVQGKPAPPGTYAFAVTVQNRARVSGSAPRKLPPTANAAAAGTGVTVGGLAAAPPLEPVRAGTAAVVGLTGGSGRVRWSLSGLGSGKPLVHGRGRPPSLRVRIPRSAGTGVYVLRAGPSSVPIAVRGARGGRVLVVLPAITWQGLNQVDDDADGFPDTLDTAQAIPLTRPFASAVEPEGFPTEIVPLLRFLGASRLPFDLTTDVALALGHGPTLTGRPGVVFAGSERWFTEPLDARLRAYVEGGGRVASFGTDAFRRTVALTPTELSAPSPPQSTNALGEQTALVDSAAAPLVVNPGDSLGLFGGTDGFVGLFTRFEQSQRRVSGADLAASAGRDPNHPAFVAYHLGQGLVVRIGTPEWTASLASDTEIANVTKSLWSLLSR
jgi:hypothetical protein